MQKLLLLAMAFISISIKAQIVSTELNGELPAKSLQNYGLKDLMKSISNNDGEKKRTERISFEKLSEELDDIRDYQNQAVCEIGVGCLVFGSTAAGNPLGPIVGTVLILKGVADFGLSMYAENLLKDGQIPEFKTLSGFTTYLDTNDDIEMSPEQRREFVSRVEKNVLIASTLATYLISIYFAKPSKLLSSGWKYAQSGSRIYFAGNSAHTGINELFERAGNESVNDRTEGKSHKIMRQEEFSKDSTQR